MDERVSRPKLLMLRGNCSAEDKQKSPQMRAYSLGVEAEAVR